MDEYLGNIVFQRKSAFDYPGAFRVVPEIVGTLTSEKVLHGRICPTHRGFLMNTALRRIFLNVCKGTIDNVDLQTLRDFKEHKVVSRVFPNYTIRNFRERQSFRDYYFPKNILIIDSYIINYMFENEMTEFIHEIFIQQQCGIKNVEIGIGGCVIPPHHLRVCCENEMIPFTTSGYYYYSKDEHEKITAELISMNIFAVENTNYDGTVIDGMILNYCKSE